MSVHNIQKPSAAIDLVWLWSKKKFRSLLNESVLFSKLDTGGSVARSMLLQIVRTRSSLLICPCGGKNLGSMPDFLIGFDAVYNRPNHGPTLPGIQSPSDFGLSRDASMFANGGL